MLVTFLGTPTLKLSWLKH